MTVSEQCHAFGADKGVQWSPTSLGRDEWVDQATGEVMEAA
jgi:hypothetical protein